MRLLGVDFAPLNIPMKRRLETLSVAILAWSFFSGGFWGSMILLYLTFYTRFFWIALLYMAWLYYDRETPRRGGRRSDFVRRWRVWKYGTDYYPAELYKTAELDTGRNYIFGYHPHGIAAIGAVSHFGSEATGFSSLFPGITPWILTLNINFWLPLQREVFLFSGCCSADRESLKWILSKEGTGNAVVIAIGGAQEALDAHGGSYILTLRSRKGFVRCALQYGADLVPVFSFGENDIYRQVENPRGSRLRRFQETMKAFTGFSPPIFYGRGLLQYTWGYVPFRTRIATVVGAPIRVEKTENPTEEEVNLLHEKYIASLTQLFQEHKTRFGAADATLKIN